MTPRPQHLRPPRRPRRTPTLDARTARSLWLVGVTLAACAPLLAASKHSAAKSAREDALHAHGQITADARRLLDLTTPGSVPAPGSASAPGSTPGPAPAPESLSAVSRASGVPSPDLVARVRETMAAVGLPESSLRDARQSEPTPLRSAPGRSSGDSSDMDLVRLSGAATITQVSPADAARLLARWRVAEPAWIVRTVALRASATRSRDEIVDLFDLDLSFEAVAPAPGSAPGATITPITPGAPGAPSAPLTPPSREPSR